MGNPYGASCGSSITTPPSQSRVTRNRLGTVGARLSDTATGKAPKRVRTKDELASMARHPASRRKITTEAPPQPPCFCKRCLDIGSLLEELDDVVADHNAKTHAEVEQNRAFENSAYERNRKAREEHLKLMGDSDA